MRGSGIAQERLSSRARITPASRRESTVMASLTARSGRWAVASATRSSPVVRSISTRGLAVRSAKNSVWPLKRTPASYDLLVHRSGDDRVELAGERARDRTLEEREHVGHV